MTPEQLAHYQNLTFKDVQDENGIDVTLIDELLAMTPTERLAALDQFSKVDDELMQGRERIDASDVGNR